MVKLSEQSEIHLLKNFKIRCSKIVEIMAGSIAISDEDKQFLREVNHKETQYLELTPKQSEDRKKYEAELLEKGELPAGKQRALDKILLKAKTKKTLTKTEIEKKKKIIDRRDNPQLPEGAKTACKKWFKSYLYMRRYEFGSKYTEKGNAVEEESIEFIKRMLNLEYAVKNELFFENDFTHGTPDIFQPEIIYDAKNSWSYETFPLFMKKVPARYWWQGQGYMWLTGLRAYKVIYTLIDMPERIMKNEIKKALYLPENLGRSECDIREELESLFYYSGIPDELRFKQFPVEYSASACANIEKRVKMCRKYIMQELVPMLKPETIFEINTYYKSALAA